ncbi:MAG: hypothetical protein F4Y18_00835 [Cenarchaeum sp. SB0663_bin_5]|nr:hypothetical protein [Cenarchaeum sp. SB0663_bin_5]
MVLRCEVPLHKFNDEFCTKRRLHTRKRRRIVGNRRLKMAVTNYSANSDADTTNSKKQKNRDAVKNQMDQY